MSGRVVKSLLLRSPIVSRCLWSGVRCLNKDDSVGIKEVLKCRKDSDLYLMVVDENMVNPCWAQPKVVIVGAGMAGLSAASALAASGLTDLTILEATDRPGGRIMSYNMKCFVTDLGASHIEGATSMNQAFNLACQEGLIQEDNVLMNNPFTGTFMTSKGQVAPSLIECLAHHTFDLIMTQAAEIYSEGLKFDGNLQDFIEQKIQQEASIFPELHREIAVRILYGKMNELRSYWGADLSELSVDQYGAFSALPGGDARLPSGMIGLLAPLIRDLPDCVIRYCKPVTSIKWTPKGLDECEVEDGKYPVSVVTCDGDKFPADYVIVTSSLGYLKAHYHTLFSPGLPQKKVDAICKLGFGHLNHVYLLYTDPFWVWREGVVRFAWNLDELLYKDVKSEWVKGMGCVSEVPSSVQLLMGRVAGEEAKHVETLSCAKISEDVTRLFRAFTGDPTLPYPFCVLTSSWSSNKYQLGAKAYLTPESNIGHICSLTEPLPDLCSTTPPSIFFAGEATIPGYFGTVHGARMSGIREASRIIKYTHKYQGRPKRLNEPPCYEVQVKEEAKQKA